MIDQGKKRKENQLIKKDSSKTVDLSWPVSENFEMGSKNLIFSSSTKSLDPYSLIEMHINKKSQPMSVATLSEQEKTIGVQESLQSSPDFDKEKLLQHFKKLGMKGKQEPSSSLFNESQSQNNRLSTQSDNAPCDQRVYSVFND